MKYFACAALLIGCVESPAPSLDPSGTWVRETWAGPERLELGADGTFSFSASATPSPGFGPDVDHISGTYTVEGTDLHLRGTTSDGHAFESAFSVAVAGRTLVRNAMTQTSGDDPNETWRARTWTKLDGVFQVVAFSKLVKWADGAADWVSDGCIDPLDCAFRASRELCAKPSFLACEESLTTYTDLFGDWRDDGGVAHFAFDDFTFDARRLGERDLAIVEQSECREGLETGPECSLDVAYQRENVPQ